MSLNQGLVILLVGFILFGDVPKRLRELKKGLDILRENKREK